MRRWRVTRSVTWAAAAMLALVAGVATTATVRAAGPSMTIFLPSGAYYGQPNLSFHAVLSGSPAPTGTVTFQIGTGPSVFCTATISSSTASCSTTTLYDANTYPVEAIYSGDATYSGTTQTGSFSIAKASTTTTVLAASNGTCSVGSPGTTFTVAVNPQSGGSPTDFVDLFANSANVGSAQVSGDKAYVTVSSLSPGSYSITATYRGDSNFTTSTSGSCSYTLAAPPPPTPTPTPTPGAPPPPTPTPPVIGGGTGPTPTPGSGGGATPPPGQPGVSTTTSSSSGSPAGAAGTPGRVSTPPPAPPPSSDAGGSSLLPLGVTATGPVSAAVLDTSKVPDLGALSPVAGITGWTGANLTVIFLLLDCLLLAAILWTSWRGRRLTLSSLRGVLGRTAAEPESAPTVP